MRSKLAFAFGLGAAVCPVAAAAQEVITYTYDARGRLTGVSKSGGPADGVNATYSYDAADNRTNVTVTGASSGGGGSDPSQSAFVVVPLNGYTLIFVR